MLTFLNDVHGVMRVMVGLVWIVALLVGAVLLLEKTGAWLLAKAPIFMLKGLVVLLAVLFLYESGTVARDFAQWAWRHP